MESSPIAFVGSSGQAPVSFAGSFPVSHGVTDAPIGSVGLSDIIDTDAAANAVIENAVNGTAVGLTAFAVEPGETVTYTLPDSAGGLFAIDTNSGVVTKNGALDAETAQSHNITVRASSTSGKTKDRAFSITVTDDTSEFAVGAITDVNAGANEVIESAANGTAVGITASASDADVTDTITYTLDDSAGGRFAIGSTSGIVTVADTGLIDFETDPSHTITVRATSTDASFSTQGFTITILNDVADDGLAEAARFDGTSDAITRVAAPTGAVDGVNGTFAIPIKMMGGDTTLQYIWSNETGSYIRRNADGKVEALFADAAGVERAKIISTNTLRIADGWTLLLVNPDKMYFGNTDETGTRTTGAATDIDWTSGFNWGEDSGGGNRGNFELARPWLALEAYDLTLQANRDKFFTSLTPLTLADIKTDGSGPTGTQALDFLPNGYSTFVTNAGSGGSYSEVGELQTGTGPAGSVLTVPGSFAPVFEAFRFYEDGTEAGAVAIAAQDTNINRDPATDPDLQIRVRIAETGGQDGDAGEDWKIQVSLNGGAYGNVPSAQVIVNASSALTNGGATTERLTGGLGTFLQGIQEEHDATVLNFLQEANKFTEHVFALSLVDAQLTPADTLDFRMRRGNGGNPFTQSPPVVPRITVV